MKRVVQVVKEVVQRVAQVVKAVVKEVGKVVKVVMTVKFGKKAWKDAKPGKVVKIVRDVVVVVKIVKVEENAVVVDAVKGVKSKVVNGGEFVTVGYGKVQVA